MVARPDLATAALARHSVKVMLANQAPSGAYLASPNFAVYRYSWLRDGAFIADSLSAAGEQASALGFLEWCRRLVEERHARVEALVRRRAAGERIELAEFLHTRYTVDGRDSDEQWWNHQLDGYGAWLWSLGRHFSRARMNSEGGRFAPAVETTARYLAAFWDHNCFDCWEENPEQVHVATLAAISAGLRVAAEWPGVAPAVQEQAINVVAAIERRVRAEGVRDGHLVKWLGGSQLDASLLFCAVPYGLLAPDDPLMRKTVEAMSPGLFHLGVHRHPDDVFFGGGEWILLAACLGSYLVSVGDIAGARAQLEWVVAQAEERGQLPEQVSAHLLHPECYQEWVDRWGEVARPLLWSHAMFLNLARELREAA
jgi:isomaltose glucohydrolase